MKTLDTSHFTNWFYTQNIYIYVVLIHFYGDTYTEWAWIKYYSIYCLNTLCLNFCLSDRLFLYRCFYLRIWMSTPFASGCSMGNAVSIQGLWSHIKDWKWGYVALSCFDFFCLYLSLVLNLPANCSNTILQSQCLQHHTVSHINPSALSAQIYSALIRWTGVLQTEHIQDNTRPHRDRLLQQQSCPLDQPVLSQRRWQPQDETPGLWI